MLGFKRKTKMYEIDFARTKEYTTRDGRKAVLTSHDSVGLPGSYEYVGYIVPRGVEDDPAERIYRFWCGLGSARASDRSIISPSALDIVGPWKEEKKIPEINWDIFPSYFRYLAMDEGGSWWAYYDRPELCRGVWCSDDSCGIWRSDYDTCFEIADDNTPDFRGNWEDSLLIRPGRNPIKDHD